MFLFTTVERTDPVQSALRYASQNTGVDFDYLVATAKRESNLDPAARAGTSSASGLFQFIESTWLATLKQAGPRHGYSDLAERIERNAQGRYSVSDADARQKILSLRNDPNVSALMAGELTRSNADQLQRGVGRTPSPGELYIAHFLGARGAIELIRLVETAPQTAAAQHFPAAAKANRPIFFTGDGHPRTARELYANLISRHNATAVSSPETKPAAAYVPKPERADQIFHGLFSDLRSNHALGPIARSVGAFWSGLFTGSFGAGQR